MCGTETGVGVRRLCRGRVGQQSQAAAAMPCVLQVNNLFPVPAALPCLLSKPSWLLVLLSLVLLLQVGWLTCFPGIAGRELSRSGDVRGGEAALEQGRSLPVVKA